MRLDSAHRELINKLKKVGFEVRIVDGFWIDFYSGSHLIRVEEHMYPSRRKFYTIMDRGRKVGEFNSLIDALLFLVRKYCKKQKGPLDQFLM